MLELTKQEYNRIGQDFRGRYMDYHGTHPEWKGRRTVVTFIHGQGTTLLIEGVGFRIIDE